MFFDEKRYCRAAPTSDTGDVIGLVQGPLELLGDRGSVFDDQELLFSQTCLCMEIWLFRP